MKRQAYEPPRANRPGSFDCEAHPSEWLLGRLGVGLVLVAGIAPRVSGNAAVPAPGTGAVDGGAKGK